MDAWTMLRERRSIRKFKDQKVDRKIMEEIIETATYAPTWANFQIVRYTVVDNKELMRTIGDQGYNDFKGNIAILNNAAGVVIVSYVNGKSGHAPTGEVVSDKGDTWSMFDAGAATLQFCLAAYEKGVGTVIQGIFDEEKIAEIIELQKDERIAAVVPYGYEEVHPKAPKRRSVEEIARFR